MDYPAEPTGYHSFGFVQNADLLQDSLRILHTV